MGVRREKIAISGPRARSTAAGLRPRASSSDSAAITCTAASSSPSRPNTKRSQWTASLYVPNDSLFVFDVGPPREHRGWNDYREDWKQLFAGFKDNPTFEITEFGMTIDGDVAYTHSAQRITANTGAKNPLDGRRSRYFDVLRKINGKWFDRSRNTSRSQWISLL